jgi:hypothetical protein
VGRAGELGNLTALQRLEIKRFLEVGGTMIVAAAAGGDAMAAAERRVAAALGDSKLAFANGEPGTRSASLGTGVVLVVAPQNKPADAAIEAIVAGRAKLRERVVIERK